MRKVFIQTSEALYEARVTGTSFSDAVNRILETRGHYFFFTNMHGSVQQEVAVRIDMIESFTDGGVVEPEKGALEGDFL